MRPWEKQLHESADWSPKNLSHLHIAVMHGKNLVETCLKAGVSFLVPCVHCLGFLLTAVGLQFSTLI